MAGLRRWIVPLLVVGGILAAPLVLAFVFRTPLARGMDWIRAAGVFGIAVFTSLYVAGIVAMMSMALLSAAGGYLFGWPYGLVIVIPTALLGACSAFAASRFVVRQRIPDVLARDPRYQAIGRAVSRGGLRMVVLLRAATFLPHNLLNYALGSTPLRFRDFALGTAVGTLPMVAVQVYAGSLAHNAREVLAGRAAPPRAATYVLTALGLAITVAAVLIAARLARRELDRVLEGAG